MKLFLSWSGHRGKQVAFALRDWLPCVIQAIEPWMSSEDIEKGARWSAHIASELATTAAGIICITPENRDAPWLNFEAGALSKAVDKEMVCPYLFHLKPGDLTGPLVQFQASETTKEDTHRLVATLNRAILKPMSEVKLREAFDTWWEKLEGKLAAIPSTAESSSPARRPEDLLEEILNTVRDQSRTTQYAVSILEHARMVGFTDQRIGSNVWVDSSASGSFGGLIGVRPTTSINYLSTPTSGSLGMIGGPIGERPEFHSGEPKFGGLQSPKFGKSGSEE
jgi:hypothetical protein